MNERRVGVRGTNELHVVSKDERLRKRVVLARWTDGWMCFGGIVATAARHVLCQVQEDDDGGLRRVGAVRC